ncbi:MAG: ACT domain-containing protein [Aureliella sp.]
MDSKFGIRVLHGDFKIVKVPKQTELTSIGDVLNSSFYSITSSPSEFSIVCEESIMVEAEKQDRGWALMIIDAVMDFDLVGILAGVLNPLRDAGIGIFAISTFDTDYILVRSTQLEIALDALRQNEFKVVYS